MPKSTLDASSLLAQVEETAKNQGIYWVGVADISRFSAPGHLPASTGWGDFPRAVSLLSPMSYALVDALASREAAVAHTYAIHYQALNQLLDRAALAVAQTLEANGYRSLPVPASQPLPPDHITGLFSHKLAAHLAGGGWIGRHALFISHRWGPRVRLATVLTQAPLPGTRAIAETGCGKCRACEKICPAGALRGRDFNPEEGVESRVDVRACLQYLEERKERLGLEYSSTACGLCLQVCPQAPSLPVQADARFNSEEISGE